jgi:hypothetical protein
MYAIRSELAPTSKETLYAHQALSGCCILIAAATHTYPTTVPGSPECATGRVQWEDAMITPHGHPAASTGGRSSSTTSSGACW